MSSAGLVTVTPASKAVDVWNKLVFNFHIV